MYPPPIFLSSWQVVLQMRSNAVAWNPQEPMNFVCANEDTNLYTFDLRNLNQVSDTFDKDKRMLMVAIVGRGVCVRYIRWFFSCGPPLPPSVGTEEFLSDSPVLAHGSCAAEVLI